MKYENKFTVIHLHGRPFSDIQNLFREADKDLEAKNKTIETLSKGLKAVRVLMDESTGVSGLHLNGDIAEWHELMEGGFSEEWLTEFNIAEELLTKDSTNQ